MKTLDQLLAELFGNTKTSPWEHPLEKIFAKEDRGKYLYTNELLEKLGDAIQMHDSKGVEYLCLISEVDGIDKRFTNILCKLLEENWHHSHEDIVMMMEIIKDPASVDCMYKISINIPSYDDGRSLAKKCIWALGAINTADAKEKLKMLSMSDDEIIKNAAVMQLQYMRE